MVVSNLAQARLIASPSLDIDPHWVDYRTCLRTPSARVFLGALVSMTPGTLTCDLQGDRLCIHVLGIDSDTNVAQRIRERFESLLEQMEAARALVSAGEHFGRNIIAATSARPSE